jgi:hypothetical protein
VDDDLKTLLEKKAEEMRLDRRLPPHVLRRARRRRAATAVVAGAVAAGALAGVFVAARLLPQETGAGPRDVRPAGTPQAVYPFIFPSTREGLENTQAEVAQGSMPLWTRPEGTAVLFAVNVLGWDMEDVEVDVRGDTPVTAVVTNPTLSEAAGAEADLRTILHLVRLPDGDAPMYVVLAAQAEVIELEPVGPEIRLPVPGGSLALRGRVTFVPEGGSVGVTVENGEGGEAIASAPLTRLDGRFSIGVSLPGDIGPDTLISVDLQDRSGRILALTSGRLASPVVAGSEAEASEPALVAPPEGLPRAIARTHRAILDAALARDWDALRVLIPETGFTFSFGGQRDPIRYWQELEAQGEPVLETLIGVLLTTPFPSNQYIWPAAAAKVPSEWTAQDRVELASIATDQEIRDWQRADLYYGWRVGIARDGTWVFFVAGD